ncbi:hypothetical protein HAX54_026305 [Datura stramonium]|uniref:Uncharacterized protein n=1 Tax=Datura stramonium TaxID=4076 RepID=A0ABS8V2J0_DATST|nr:hypothetical protein [Datura stramonium]
MRRICRNGCRNQGCLPRKWTYKEWMLGKRLVALNNIRKGEKLLFVPPSLVITADSKWSNSEAGDVLKQYNVPDWPFIATYLISEASLMKSSRWNNYISALPRQHLFSLILVFGSITNKRAGSGERINNVIGTYNDLRLRIFSSILIYFLKRSSDWLLDSPGSALSRTDWMCYEKNVRPAMIMVVWRDIQHRDFQLVIWNSLLTFGQVTLYGWKVETFLDYDKSSQGIVFTTDRAYLPGEQVLYHMEGNLNGEAFVHMDLF